MSLSQTLPANPQNGAGAGDPVDGSVQACAGVSSGLGADVDAVVAKSPTLSENIDELQQDGWTITYGAAGGGSYADKTKKQIVIDENGKANPAGVAQTLAHESGHGLYAEDPYVPPAGLSEQEYAAANARRHLKDEGEATLMNLQVRDEINQNGGPDIGVAGTQTADYEKAYASYQTHQDRERARDEIGALFADGERPSTDPSKTYRQYYGQTYSDFYKKHPPTP